MAMTVNNPQKGRLETIDATITDENTTWFEDCVTHEEIYTITDYKGGVLIREFNWNYPMWVYDVTRADIGYDQEKARELHRMHR